VLPVVVCSVDGARAARLRAHGVEVLVADTATATSTLRRAEVDVIALHGGGEELESAVLATGVPVVPVLHNTEIHFTPARWRRFSSALTRSASAIAVSELVRDFHAAHVPSAAAARLRVVPNAAGRMPAVTAEERRRARGALGALLSADLADDVVVVCLARYDAQKNISGLVASFLAQVRDPRIRLVIAGQPSDGAEARRADAIRRRGPAGGRVALLAESDARTLLAAADAFVLDSFFEGWPVAATEAAAMGLPLILSDVGGARELVQRDPANAVLIANPSGPAAAVTDASVARARRRSTRQRNAVELGAAIDAVAARVRVGVRGEPVDAGALVCAMMEGHAVILREAAAERMRGAGEAPTTARAGGSR
jgi:glycosyltransferase involved in cell wall biosynthesis